MSLAAHQSFARTLADRNETIAELTRDLTALRTQHRIACAVIEEFLLGEEFRKQIAAYESGRKRRRSRRQSPAAPVVASAPSVSPVPPEDRAPASAARQAHGDGAESFSTARGEA